MIASGTGHRPEKLMGYGEQERHLLCSFAVIILSLIKPTQVVSGMAQGWDQALAMAATLLDIPWTAAIPFQGFANKWPLEAQKRMAGLANEASRVKFVCDPGYAAWKLQKRNEWMVDRLKNPGDLLIALWDGSDGGTANCIRYAKKRNVEILNLWPLFEVWRRNLE